MGKARQSDIREAPKSSAAAIFTAPRKRMEPLLRAPNRYWPARPPAPWHIGIAPNQAPTRFITPTEIATLRGWAGRSGKRSAESTQTATTEFKVVRGICGTAASRKALEKLDQRGGWNVGSHGARCTLPGAFHNASARPAPKRTSAAGMRRDGRRSTAVKPASAPAR